MDRRFKIITIRVCSSCNRDATVVKFSEGNFNKCNECLKFQRRKWYDKNKYEINEKKKAWRRRVSEIPEMVTEIKRSKGRPVNVETYEPKFDEKNLKVIEIYCSVWGCGKRLTRTEGLAGVKCLRHQEYVREVF